MEACERGCGGRSWGEGGRGDDLLGAVVSLWDSVVSQKLKYFRTWSCA